MSEQVTHRGPSWTLVALGIAATAGSVYTGLARLRRFEMGPVVNQAWKRVTITPRNIQYFEGENVMVLAAAPTSDREGPHHVFYLPSEAEWLKQTPRWCRYRRAAVIGEIERLTASGPIWWVEESDPRSNGPPRLPLQLPLGQLRPRHR
jgi:hypothetical protein